MTLLLIKRCPKCGHLLGLGSFYRKRNRPGGVDSWCKDCTKNQIKLYNKTSGGKLCKSKASRKHREKFPDKIKARNRTHYMVKIGILKKKSCEVCGKEEVEAHHADYSKPIEVRWLCKQHHTELHKAICKHEEEPHYETI